MASAKTLFLGGLLCATALTSFGQLDTLQCGFSNLAWSVDTTCLLSGTNSADFSHNLPSSEYFYNSNPNLTMEWVSVPDSATASFGTKHAYFYSSGQGSASFQFEVSHFGTYVGLMTVQSSQCSNTVEIPFEIVVQAPEPTTVIESNWEVAGASNGFPTCSSAGLAETEFEHPLQLNALVSPFGEEIEWTTYPDSIPPLAYSEYAILQTDGSGVADFNYANAIPGFYQGNLGFTFDNGCQSVALPFEYFVSPIYSTAVPSDLTWESTHDGSVCAHYGRLDAAFTHPFNQTTYLNSNTVDVLFEVAPNGSDPEVYYYDGFLSSNGNGTAFFEFNSASPGTYSGRMRLEVGDECQYIELPFEFAVQPIEEHEVVSNVIWSSTGGGDTTCHSLIYTSASFNHTKGTTLYLNQQTIDIEWTNIPDSSGLAFYSYDGTLYSDSTGSAYMNFHSATPGDYSGFMVLKDEEECKSYDVPFAFTVASPTAIQPSSLTWSDDFSVDSTCSIQGGGDADFNHALDLTSNVYFNYGTIDILWTDFPDSSSLSLGTYDATAYANGTGTAYLNYQNASPGHYAGAMHLDYGDDCAYLVLPFEFHVSENIQTTVPEDLIWTDELSGDTTCATSGYGSASFTHSFDYVNFNSSTIDFVWEEQPDSSTLNIYSFDATLYSSGSGNAYLYFNNAVPGLYRGNMVLDMAEDCASLVLPFEFHVSEDIQTTVPGDLSWTDELSGDITCATSGYGSASFTHSFDYVNFNSSTIDFVWEEQPDSSTLNIYSFDATLYSSGSGNAYLYFNNAVPGLYRGNMVLDLDEDCARISLPFEFTVNNIEDVVLAEDVEWSGALNGDSTCYSLGYDAVEFTHSQQQSFNLTSATIDVVLTSQPDSAAMSFSSFDAGLSSNGTGWAWVEYNSSIPGFYEGYLRCQLTEACQYLDVPFSFHVVDEAQAPVQAVMVDWESPLNGDTTCVQQLNGISASFTNPTNYPFYDYLYLNDDSLIQWVDVPDSSDFTIEYLYVDIYQEDIYVNGYFDVSTPGHYSGFFRVLPWQACQEIWIPFDVTIGADIQLFEPNDAVWTGALNGFPTCNSSGFSEVTFSHPFTDTYYLNSSTIELVWNTIPNGSEVDFGSFDATIWGSGTGSAYLNYVDAVPGFYSGEMRLNVDEQCSAVVLPFQFTVAPIYVNITPADYSWSGTYIDSPSCTNDGSLQVDFSHPYGSSFSINSSFIDIAWTEEPTGSDVTVYRNASFNSDGTGSVDLDITGALPGAYDGTVTVELGDQCQNLIFPLEFEVGAIDNWVVLEDYTWDDPLDGDTTCSSTLLSSRYASFTHSWSQTLYLNPNTIDFIWYAIPDSSTIEFISYDATIYNSGNGSAYLRYAHATPGLYQGGMRLEDESNCEGLEIPFQFYVDSITSVFQPDELSWSGAMNGDTTCITQGYAEATFEHPYGQTFYLNPNTIDFEWYQTPDSSGIDIYSYDASLYSTGNGSAYFYYEDAIPGLYEGVMTLEVGDECEYLTLPFEFTIVPDSAPPAIPSVVQWSNYLNGDTTCVSSFYASTSFTNPTNLSGHWIATSGNENIEWEVVPDSSDVELQSLNLSINGDYASVACDFEVSVNGLYRGHFKTLSDFSCQELWIPFEFTLSDEFNQIEAADLVWSGALNGDSTCITQGYTEATFEHPYDQSFYLNSNTIGFEWYQTPDSSGVNTYSYDASLYSNGDGSAYFYYEDAIQGLYEGAMILEVGDECEYLTLPFEFTVVPDSAPPAIPSDVQWNNYLNGDTTCVQSFFASTSFTNPTNLSGHWNATSGNENIEWEVVPDSSDVELQSLYLDIYGNNAYVECYFEVSVHGLYRGHFKTLSDFSCQELWIPFEFTLSDDINQIEAADLVWSGYMNGDTTCSSTGYTQAIFAHPYDQGFGLSSNTIDFEWYQTPDSSDLNIYSFDANIYSNGNGLAFFNYEDAIPGLYEGAMILEIGEECESLILPFEFTVAQTDVLGICGGNCIADLDFDGICDIEDDCVCIESDCSAVESLGDSLAGDTIVLEEYLFGGQTASNSFLLSGNLEYVDIVLSWQGGGSSWPADLAIVIEAPNGLCVAWWGYSSNGIPAGCNDLGSIWPSNWFTTSWGIYSFFIDTNSTPSIPNTLSGSGEWTISLINAYSNSQYAEYDMEITLGGLYPSCPGECNDILACNYVESPALVNNFLCDYTDEVPGGVCDCETGDVYDLNLTCGGDCWEDLDEDGICDLDDEAFCGEGTYFNEVLNVCLPVESCLGDFNASLSVTTEDLLTILSEYGLTCNPDLEACTTDLNEDGLCDELEHPMCGTGTVWNASLGQCVTNLSCQTDLDFSGAVTVNDLIIVLGVYGTDCD